MPKIVISYRRQDSEAITGRIRDRLANQYGDQSVFMDIDSIPFGVDFRERLGEALQETDILIAVIGPKWTGIQKGGRPRIREENDPVKIEIEHALERGIPLIPILVNKATMPQLAALPDGLKELSYRNAATVDSGRDFHQHMDRLIRSMDQILSSGAKPTSPAGASTTSRNADIVAALEPSRVGDPGKTNPQAGASVMRETALATATDPASATSLTAVTALRAPKRWLAVAAGAAICVMAASGAYLYWKGGPKPVPNDETAKSSQPQIDHPIKPALPTTAALDTHCKPEDGPAFYDDFKSSDGGWGQTGPNFYFENGQMALKPGVAANSTRIYLPLLFKNVIICSEITTAAEQATGDAGAGIVFWAGDYQNYYTAIIFPDSTYAVFRKIAGTWATVVPRVKADAIRPWRPNVVNQMKVITGDNAASLLINGVKIVNFWGQPPVRGGSAGFYAQSDAGAQTEWKFSNIAVARLDDAAAPSAKALFPARDIALLSACKPNASVAFVDDFNPHNPGWSTSGDAISFKDGEVIFEPKPKKAAQMFFPSLIFKTGTVCADIKLPPQSAISGSSGLIFWAIDFQNYYVASIYQDGTYDVFRKIDGKWAQVRPRTTAPSIRHDSGAINRIKIAFDNDMATLTINDANIVQFRGQPARSGGFVGIAADSDDAENEWTFLNTAVMVDDKPAGRTPLSDSPAAMAAAKGCKLSPIPVSFFDDFKSPDPGWGNPTADRTFRDGWMVLNSKTEAAVAWIYSPLVFKNATICSDIIAPSAAKSVNGDPAGGVIFWAADYQNYYLAEVYADSTYSVYRKLADKWIVVRPRTKSDAIRGAGAVNRMKVTTAGNYVALFANDKKILDLWGQPPNRGGAVGFFAQFEPGKEEGWRFSNIIVVEDSQAQPEYPTAALAISAKCDENASLAFFDDFKSVDSLDPGWGSLTPAFTLKEGALNVTPERDHAAALIYFPLVFSSATVCLETRSPPQIDNPGNAGAAGIIFWALDYDNYYIAGLSPDGTYAVWRKIGGDAVPVVSKTKAGMINQGPDAVNRMKIAIQPNNATLSINGSVAVVFRGQPSAGGTAFGLYVESGGKIENLWRLTNMAILD
jgi:hypothetical protein